MMEMTMRTMISECPQYFYILFTSPNSKKSHRISQLAVKKWKTLEEEVLAKNLNRTKLLEFL